MRLGLKGTVFCMNEPSRRERGARQMLEELLCLWRKCVLMGPII